MSVRLQAQWGQKEDFFTKLSFSTLIGELNDKENIMINHKDLYLNRQNSQIAKFSKDSEKWINAKTDEDLINILLI